MGIKYNGKDIVPKFNGKDVSRVMYNGKQIYPSNQPQIVSGNIANVSGIILADSTHLINKLDSIKLSITIGVPSSIGNTSIGADTNLFGLIRNGVPEAPAFLGYYGQTGYTWNYVIADDNYKTGNPITAGSTLNFDIEFNNLTSNEKQLKYSGTIGYATANTERINETSRILTDDEYNSLFTNNNAIFKRSIAVINISGTYELNYIA